MKKKLLGTSDTWSMSHFFHRPSKPAQYIVDCRISKKPTASYISQISYCADKDTRFSVKWCTLNYSDRCVASHCKPIKYSPKRGDKKDQKKGNKLKGFFPKLNFGSVSKISLILDQKTKFLSMISKWVPNILKLQKSH